MSYARYDPLKSTDEDLVFDDVVNEVSNTRTSFRASSGDELITRNNRQLPKVPSEKIEGSGALGVGDDADGADAEIEGSTGGSRTPRNGLTPSVPTGKESKSRS